MNWFDVVNVAFLLLLSCASFLLLACKYWAQHHKIELGSVGIDFWSNKQACPHCAGKSAGRTGSEHEGRAALRLHDVLSKLARAERRIVQLEADDWKARSRMHELDSIIASMRLYNLKLSSQLSSRSLIVENPWHERMPHIGSCANVLIAPPLGITLCASPALRSISVSAIDEIDITVSSVPLVTGSLIMREHCVDPRIWASIVKHGSVVYRGESARNFIPGATVIGSIVDAPGTSDEMTNGPRYKVPQGLAQQQNDNSKDGINTTCVDHESAATEVRNDNNDGEGQKKKKKEDEAASENLVPIEALRAGQFSRFTKIYRSVATVASEKGEQGVKSNGTEASCENVGRAPATELFSAAHLPRFAGSCSNLGFNSVDAVLNVKPVRPHIGNGLTKLLIR